MDRLLYWLLGCVPMGQAVPELGALQADPEEELTRRDIVIRTARPFKAVLILVIGVPLLGFALYGTQTVGIGIAGCSILLGSLWLLLGGTSVALTREGFAVHQGAVVTRYPWALLDVPGAAVVDSGVALLLPIAPKGIPGVERWRHGVLTARGEAALGRLGRSTERQLTLPFGCRARPAELGELLLYLGRALGASAPAPTSVEPAASSTGGPAGIDQRGWLTADLTRLAFPGSCCGCGVPTEACYEVEAAIPAAWLFGILGLDWTATIPIPTCTDCQGQQQRRTRLAAAIGIVLGAGISLVATYLVAGLEGMQVFGIALTCGVIGGMLGLRWGPGWKSPVQVGRYSPWRQRVSLRFLRPGYGALVLAAITGEADHGSATAGRSEGESDGHRPRRRRGVTSAS